MIKGEWELISKSVKNLSKNNSHIIKVACVLAYFKGSKFIKDQIQSIIDQDNEDIFITIFITDDNSQEIFPSLKDLNIRNFGKINIFYRSSKTNNGYTQNFLSALNLIESDFDYFCFSDQDDIWNKDKINRSIQILRKFKNNKPSLYFGRTDYFNKNCSIKIGTSTLFKKKPSFKNAIIQNMAGGNTMLFNKSAKEIITSLNFLDVVSHDWFCYQIVSGIGGNIYYDNKPCLKYRQHSSNILGSNNKLSDRILRFKKLFNGRLKGWNEKNIYALNEHRAFFTEQNRLVLDNFKLASKSSFFKRINLFYKTGIYRQNTMGNFALLIALLLKKI